MLPDNDPDAIRAIGELTHNLKNAEVINAANYNILACTGCKSCMCRTSGMCCLKDDFEKIVKLVFEHMNVIVLSDSSLGFLDHQTMRLFERRFSFCVKLCEFRDNNVRHIRYKRTFGFGILYKGNADSGILNEWLTLYTNHTDDIPIGVYPIDQAEELSKCILQL